MGLLRRAEGVSAETIDGEAVAINLDSGLYYRMDGVAGFAWERIEAGITQEGLLSQVVAAYDVARDIATEDVRAFVEDLMGEALISRSDGGNPETSGVADASDRPTEPYNKPQLERYDDLQDLLLLDPIHDVDEAGWPESRPEPMSETSSAADPTEAPPANNGA
jgi:hypothetical protein